MFKIIKVKFSAFWRAQHSKVTMIRKAKLLYELVIRRYQWECADKQEC